MKVVLKQITKFGIIGVSAVLVDGIVYYFFSDILSVDSKLSKGLGFLVGTIYTYFLNKRWTWKYTEKSNKGMLLKFALVYAVSMGFNVFINEYVITAMPDNVFEINMRSTTETVNFFSIKSDKFLAFFFATVASAVINFFGQKFLVFNKVKLDPKDETKIEVS
ncbi:MAG TPA: GtrA family protein [Bacteroidia bacterium]